jgi:hypothetical protein
MTASDEKAALFRALKDQEGIKDISFIRQKGSEKRRLDFKLRNRLP